MLDCAERRRTGDKKPLDNKSSNAWDAHIEAGIPEVPIQVTLPTALMPQILIRDFGKGLSEEDVFGVYTQYGASTKRTTNEQMGSFGIGAKSGFAYADSFTVTSFHGGKKRVFLAVLDASNVGVMKKVHEEDSEETGVEIRIPVLPGDAKSFESTARSLLQYFQPQPRTNITLDNPFEGKEHTDLGYLAERKGDWSVLMGCVCYGLNIAAAVSAVPEGTYSEEQKALLENLRQKWSGILTLPIGSVTVSASRETVEYTEKTALAVCGALLSMQDRLRQKLLDTLSSFTPGVNQARQVAAWRAKSGAWLPQEIGAKYPAQLPTPVKYEVREQVDGKWVVHPRYGIEKAPHLDFSAISVQLAHTSRTKSVLENTIYVPLSDLLQRKLLLNDRGLAGPKLRYLDEVAGDLYVIHCKGDPVQAEAQLKTLLEYWGLPDKGYYVASKCALDLPAHVTNNKYSKRTFAWNGGRSRCSQDWTVHTEPLEKDDLFLVLREFQTDPSTGALGGIEEALKGLFGVEMPHIYGIRHTSKHPVVEKDVPATHFNVWLEATKKKLWEENPDLEEALIILNDSSWSVRSYEATNHMEMLTPELQQVVDVRNRMVRWARLRAGGRDNFELELIKAADKVALWVRTLWGSEAPSALTDKYAEALKPFPVLAALGASLSELGKPVIVRYMKEQLAKKPKKSRKTKEQKNADANVHDHEGNDHPDHRRGDAHGEAGGSPLEGHPGSGDGRGLGEGEGAGEPGDPRAAVEPRCIPVLEREAGVQGGGPAGGPVHPHRDHGPGGEEASGPDELLGTPAEEPELPLGAAALGVPEALEPAVDGRRVHPGVQECAAGLA